MRHIENLPRQGRAALYLNMVLVQVAAKQRHDQAEYVEWLLDRFVTSEAMQRVRS